MKKTFKSQKHINSEINSFQIKKQYQIPRKIATQILEREAPSKSQV